MKHIKTPVIKRLEWGCWVIQEQGGREAARVLIETPNAKDVAEGITVALNEHDRLVEERTDLLAACERMANDGRFYKFNRDRVKYTCLACGASGDIPRSIQHEEWCIIKEALAAIAKAKGER